MDERVAAGLHAGALVSVLGALAWVTGLPTLFPSLGPSAYVMAVFPTSEASDARRVVGGHVVGVVVGFAAYHLLAAGATLGGTAAATPMSTSGLHLAVSGILATTLTTGAMLAAGVEHPPAVATTLIVSLGLLPTPVEAGLVAVAVVVLVGVQRLLLARGRLAGFLWRSLGREV